MHGRPPLGDKASLEALARAADLPADERTRYLAGLVHSTTTPPERIDEDLAVRAQHPTSPEGYSHQLVGTAEWERLADLGKISCPTLVLHGDQDRLVSVENARTLADHVPNAKLTVLADSGHQLFTDQPDAGARTVMKFLGSVDGTTDRP